VTDRRAHRAIMERLSDYAPDGTVAGVAFATLVQALADAAYGTEQERDDALECIADDDAMDILCGSCELEPEWVRRVCAALMEGA